MMKKRRKETTEKTTSKEATEKTTSKAQALDDEALKGIVGGTGGLEFTGESVGPDWSQDG